MEMQEQYYFRTIFDIGHVFDDKLKNWGKKLEDSTQARAREHNKNLTESRTSSSLSTIELSASSESSGQKGQLKTLKEEKPSSSLSSIGLTASSGSGGQKGQSSLEESDPSSSLVSNGSGSNEQNDHDSHEDQSATGKAALTIADSKVSGHMRLLVLVTLVIMLFFYRSTCGGSIIIIHNYHNNCNRSAQ